MAQWLPLMKYCATVFAWFRSWWIVVSSTSVLGRLSFLLFLIDRASSEDVGNMCLVFFFCGLDFWEAVEKWACLCRVRDEGEVGRGLDAEGVGCRLISHR